jgi:hypothetical protein
MIIKEIEEGCAQYYARIHDTNLFLNSSYGRGFKDGEFRHATDQEKQLLIDKLNENGKHFDESTMEIVDWKWTPEYDEECYIVNELYKIIKVKYCPQHYHYLQLDLVFKNSLEADKYIEHCKSYFKK